MNWDWHRVSMNETNKLTEGRNARFQIIRFHKEHELFAKVFGSRHRGELGGAISLILGNY